MSESIKNPYVRGVAITGIVLFVLLSLAGFVIAMYVMVTYDKHKTYPPSTCPNSTCEEDTSTKDGFVVKSATIDQLKTSSITLPSPPSGLVSSQVTTEGLNLNGLNLINVSKVYDSSGQQIAGNPNVVIDPIVYVDAKDGDDDSDGMTISTAVKTLSGAINNINARAYSWSGDCRFNCVNNGVYTLDTAVVLMNGSGTVTFTGLLEVVESQVSIISHDYPDKSGSQLNVVVSTPVTDLQYDDHLVSFGSSTAFIKNTIAPNVLDLCYGDNNSIPQTPGATLDISMIVTDLTWTSAHVRKFGGASVVSFDKFKMYSTKQMDVAVPVKITNCKVITSGNYMDVPSGSCFNPIVSAHIGVQTSVDQSKFAAQTAGMVFVINDMTIEHVVSRAPFFAQTERLVLYNSILSRPSTYPYTFQSYGLMGFGGNYLRREFFLNFNNFNGIILATEFRNMLSVTSGSTVSISNVAIVSVSGAVQVFDSVLDVNDKVYIEAPFLQNFQVAFRVQNNANIGFGTNSTAISGDVGVGGLISLFSNCNVYTQGKQLVNLTTQNATPVNMGSLGSIAMPNASVNDYDETSSKNVSFVY
jgi:hypothetical protein